MVGFYVMVSDFIGFNERQKIHVSIRDMGAGE